MFVYSFRASTLKFVAVLILSGVLLATMIALIPSMGEDSVTASSRAVKFTGIRDNEDRIRFLSSFGWTVSEQPAAEAQVTVPAQFDRVLSRYNDLQLDQGLDLTRYKRKTLTRYTYLVTNYPDAPGAVYANLLIYRGRVVGADLCSASPDGFVVGLNGK